MKLMLGTSQGGVQLPGEAIHMKTADIPDGNSLYHILIHLALAHPFPITSNPLYTCLYYANKLCPFSKEIFSATVEFMGNKERDSNISCSCSCSVWL